MKLFESGSTESLGQLRAAFKPRATCKLPPASATSFRASAANVGALIYARRIRELERLCIAGQETQDATDLHQALQTAHRPLLEALRGLSLKASA